MSPATTDGSTIYFRKWHPDIHIHPYQRWRGFSSMVTWKKETNTFEEQSFSVSFEDPRAFIFKGSTHLIFHNQSDMVLWDLQNDFVTLKPPQHYPRHDEKNWAPYQYTSTNLIFVYSIVPLVVLVYDHIEGKLLTELGEKNKAGIISPYRGGTPFLNGKALGHCVEWRPTVGNDIRWYQPFVVELDIRNLHCVVHRPFEFEPYKGRRVQFPTTLTETMKKKQINDAHYTELVRNYHWCFSLGKKKLLQIPHHFPTCDRYLGNCSLFICDCFRNHEWRRCSCYIQQRNSEDKSRRAYLSINRHPIFPYYQFSSSHCSLRKKLGHFQVGPHFDLRYFSRRLGSSSKMSCLIACEHCEETISHTGILPFGVFRKDPVKFVYHPQCAKLTIAPFLQTLGELSKSHVVSVIARHLANFDEEPLLIHPINEFYRCLFHFIEEENHGWLVVKYPFPVWYYEKDHQTRDWKEPTKEHYKKAAKYCDEPKELSCCICLELFPDKMLECTHFAHKQCLLKAVLQSRTHTCRTCKKSFSPIPSLQKNFFLRTLSNYHSEFPEKFQEIEAFFSQPISIDTCIAALWSLSIQCAEKAKEIAPQAELVWKKFQQISLK
ncbi:hypothetical protein Gasu2_33770 [Galdieria sulphuraria]|nr:hypothetical protein Gasu2_33770 [Galdieria sulphuraria]